MKISGVVEKGAGLGKSNFVPTINLMLDQIPDNLEFGVYACRANILGDTFGGVVHYGPRTTVDNLMTFEINLFNFNSEVYGEKVEVELYDKIREIEKFKDFVDLKRQILEDVETAKKIIKNI